MRHSILKQKDLVDFTDEEGYGKFLDLHHVYMKFCNLKQFLVSTITLVNSLLGNAVSFIEN